MIAAMLDLGDYLLEADARCVTLHRKTTRKNQKTGIESPHVDVVGHYASFEQAAARLAHISAAGAVAAGYGVDRVREAVAEAAARIERALSSHNAAEQQITRV